MWKNVSGYKNFTKKLYYVILCIEMRGKPKTPQLKNKKERGKKMANEKKFNKLSETAEAVLKVVKEAGENGILFSEIKAKIEGANPSQLTALTKRGLITAKKEDAEIVKVVKSKVNRYTFNE